MAASKEGEGSKTRILTTENGEVEIPENPQKVLATIMEGDLIAFGEKPVALMDVGVDFEKTPFYEEIKDIPVISYDDAEAVMGAEPDVIITHDKELAEKFSKIAPTVVADASGMDIKERTRLMGEILNQQDKAEELIAALDSRVLELKEKIKEAGLADKTITIMEGTGEKGSIWITTSGRGSIPL